MDQLRRLPVGRQVILGAGLLLLIDTFLPWQKISVLGFSNSWTAWHGFWGVVLGLLTIALLAWVAVRALGIDLPFELPDGITTLAAAVAILVFALIKNLVDDYSAWGSYVGVVLAAAVAYGGWLTYREVAHVQGSSAKAHDETPGAAGTI